MKVVTSLPIVFAIFCASAAYADNFHVQNRSHSDVIASVFFNGKEETCLTLKPGQEYAHSFWHNLVVTVQLSDPKTQRTCTLKVAERCYESSYITGICKYEPEIIHNGTHCPYFSSFDQANWQTHYDSWQKFSYVDVWGPHV